MWLLNLLFLVTTSTTAYGPVTIPVWVNATVERQETCEQLKEWITQGVQLKDWEFQEAACLPIKRKETM